MCAKGYEVTVKMDVVHSDDMNEGWRKRTRLLQKAIDDCSEQGGGVVIIPSGIYTIGSIQLKDNVELRLCEGALLKGVEEFDGYPAMPGGFTDAVGDERSRCLVVAYRATNIAITGFGRINGSGGYYPVGSPNHNRRPFLVRIIECQNVKISDVTLEDSPAWVCHCQASKDIELNNVKIRSRCNCNNDGIDIDSCQNVKITNCDVNTGDDALCFKSTTAMACQNIVVENSKFTTECGAIKFGTESYGDFRNISISNCVIYDTELCAIKFCCMDGAIMENIEIKDVEIVNSTGPFFFRLGDRANTYGSNPKKGAGRIKDITISNITASIMDAERQHSGVLITGIPDQSIENLKFSNITINFPGGGTENEALNTPDEQESAYPEPSFFGVLPSYGFYIRHVDGVTLENVKVSNRKADCRKAMVLEDVQNIKGELIEG